MYNEGSLWPLALDAIGGCFVFTIFAYPSVFFHELGHLVAGKIMGLTPMYLVVGESETLFRRRCLGVEVVINLVPFCGLAIVKERRPSRIQLAVFILGGPLANFGFAWLAFLLWRHTHFELTALALLFIQVGIVIANLVPRDICFEGKAVPSDGKLLLSIFSEKE